jgi:hypothetical protein
LIHLRRRFYKYASPTDFAAYASCARQKIQTPIAPNRPTQNDFGTAFVPKEQPEIRHELHELTRICFVPKGQPEISQTQGVRVLAHGQCLRTATHRPKPNPSRMDGGNLPHPGLLPKEKENRPPLF